MLAVVKEITVWLLETLGMVFRQCTEEREVSFLTHIYRHYHPTFESAVLPLSLRAGASHQIHAALWRDIQDSPKHVLAFNPHLSQLSSDS